MSGYVYFAESPDGSRVKIGHSKDPVRRVRSLRGGARFIGAVEGTRETESSLHARFYHILSGPGREWFASNGELRAFMAGLQFAEMMDETNRTASVKMPETIWRRLKAAAALRGLALQDALLCAVEEYLARADGKDPIAGAYQMGGKRGKS